NTKIKIECEKFIQSIIDPEKQKPDCTAKATFLINTLCEIRPILLLIFKNASLDLFLRGASFFLLCFIKKEIFPNLKNKAPKFYFDVKKRTVP
ncbi:MAG: hypothetical protein KJ736_06110, partial [Candidatus Omnitrophica bacterium]|nr:hypothetical protein [Candidatus Omnitrophota bacterium]